MHRSANGAVELHLPSPLFSFDLCRSIDASFVCEMPASNPPYRAILSLRRICRSNLQSRAGCGKSAQKKAPEKSGAASLGGNAGEVTREASPKKLCQRPKRGSSPVRSEMRADAISARSIAASRRAKRGVLGAKPIAAVLAMVVPFPGGRPGGRLVIWEQSMYTRCQRQRVCLHGSICAFATQYLGQ